MVLSVHSWFLTLLLFRCFRIADASVVDGLEFLYEYGLRVLYLAEGNGTLAEIAVVDL